MKTNRRHFLHSSVITAAGLTLTQPSQLSAVAPKGMRFGLVTYLWGQDWDLPTLIKNCELSGTEGVELRTTHAHGVEISLTKPERAEVLKRFADSPVTHVGIGSNERFDHPDPAVLKQAIKATRDFILLSRDTGGSGVKVKPDSFHKNVPREQTIEQIGKALNQVAAFGADHGQEIRVEVHGQCSPLPIMAQIMKIADHPNVKVCWNSNGADLEGEGLVANLAMVRDRFGATCHVRELEDPKYPYAKLLGLLKRSQYDGWVLLEARGKPADRVVALKEQKALFERLIS